MQTTYAPVLLILDDERPMLKAISRETLDTTSLGVLEAANLTQAAKYIEDPTLRIDAVLADINMHSAPQDDRLNNGLDLLRFVKDRRPGVLSYVFSVESEDSGRKKFAVSQDLPIRHWFYKLGMQNPLEKPWIVIERDLLRKALKTDPSLRDSAVSQNLSLTDALEDETLPERVRRMLKLPRRTYLQRFPAGTPYVFVEPIEAICFEDQPGQFRAMAIGLGMLEASEGNDVPSAFNNLAILIVEQYEHFCDEEPDHLVGYARFVADKLKRAVQPLPSNQ